MNMISANEWEKTLDQFSHVHVLQTAAWGGVKGRFGWYARYVAIPRAGAQILFRKLPLGFTIAYIPKGPVGQDWDALWPEVDEICRKERAIFLKLEPDLWQEQASEVRHLFSEFIGDRPTIQPRRTIMVELAGDPETWLERMNQKHRYNIRLAIKKEVVVQPSADIATFYQLMQTTGQRDAFGVHSQQYYQSVYDHFSPTDRCVLLMATYQGTALAGLIALRQGERAWYFYGASNNQERQRMPAYLLQFEAMKWAKQHGCSEYDLWGVPDEDEARLEAEFETCNDGLWGVYRFKRGFGGEVKRSVAALERVFIPALYWLYEKYSARKGGLHA